MLIMGVGIAGCQRPPEAPADVTVTALQRLVALDGDTVDAVTAGGRRVRVRLLGIDAPEIAHSRQAAQCGAVDAQRQLRRLVSESNIRLVTDPGSDSVDRYGRLLGYLDSDAGDVGLRLLQAGLVEAWHPSQTATPDRFAQYRTAEQTASQARKGSWARCGHLGR